MTTYIRKGSDCLLQLTLETTEPVVEGFAFGNVIESRIYLVKNNSIEGSSEHTPTQTSTNICCSQNYPSFRVQLKTGTINNTSNKVTFESIIPADLLTSGVYSIVLVWFIEYVIEALNIKKAMYSQDFTDTITVINNNSTSTEITTAISYTQNINPNTNQNG